MSAPEGSAATNAPAWNGRTSSSGKVVPSGKTMIFAPAVRRVRIVRTADAPLTASVRSTKSVPTARAACPTSGQRARSARLTMCPPKARKSTSTSAVERWLATMRCPPGPSAGAAPLVTTRTPKSPSSPVAHAPTHPSRMVSRRRAGATVPCARNPESMVAVRAPNPATRAARRSSRFAFTIGASSHTKPIRGRAGSGGGYASSRARFAWRSASRARTTSARGGRTRGPRRPR
jgi:hypothetical protein